MQAAYLPWCQLTLWPREGGQMAAFDGTTPVIFNVNYSSSPSPPLEYLVV